MTKSPAFQFYAKDWLSSSNIALMPPEYEGAYIRLLAYCWDSGDCSLPDEDRQLAMLSRLGEGWFKGGSEVLRKCFMPHPRKAGYLTNKRLLEEAQKQEKWREKSAAGGRASAAKRSEQSEKLRGGSRVVDTVVEPKANSSSASSSANSSVPKGTSLPTPKPPPKYSDQFEEFWAIYPRKDCSKADAYTAYKKHVTEENHGRVINGVREFSQYVAREGVERRYVPHASTWLGGRRWESDYSTNPKRGSEKQRAVAVYAEIIADRNAKAHQGLSGQPEPTEHSAGPMLPAPKGLW
jgi:uncharacterized protein YdaU (DUF1376 family)